MHLVRHAIRCQRPESPRWPSPSRRSIDNIGNFGDAGVPVGCIRSYELDKAARFKTLEVGGRLGQEGGNLLLVFDPDQGLDACARVLRPPQLHLAVLARKVSVALCVITRPVVVDPRPGDDGEHALCVLDPFLHRSCGPRGHAHVEPDRQSRVAQVSGHLLGQHGGVAVALRVADKGIPVPWKVEARRGVTDDGEDLVHPSVPVIGV